MAEMTIRLTHDPATGKKNIVVTLQRDEELLPHEHEQRHRRLVEQLIGQGLLTAAELGRIVVERQESESAAAAVPQPQDEPARIAEQGR